MRHSHLASRFVFVSLFALLSLPAINANAHCVECPIPMSSLSGVWILPEYGYLVRIESYKLDTDLIEIRLKVSDSASGQVLASGTTRIHQVQSEIPLQTYMLNGERLGVVITTDDKEQIQGLRLVK